MWILQPVRPVVADIEFEAAVTLTEFLNSVCIFIHLDWKHSFATFRALFVWSHLQVITQHLFGKIELECWLLQAVILPGWTLTPNNHEHWQLVVKQHTMMNRIWSCTIIKLCNMLPNFVQTITSQHNQKFSKSFWFIYCKWIASDNF